MTFDLSAKPSIYFLVWSCLIIQTGSISFLRKFLGIYLSPVVFVLSAILVTLFLLSIAKQKSNDVINNREKWAINQRVVIFSVFVVLLLIGWFLLKSIIPNYPIDPSKSDIIPQVKILAGRFVSGEEIYTPITEFGYLLYPTYLPLTWLPFVIADWMHIDYRFWAYLIFSACVLTPVLWIKRNFPGRILVLLLPFAVFFLFLKDQPEVFGWTIESMIAGFYLVFLYGLYKKQTRLIVLAFIFCLLSRYAIVTLIPFLLIIFFKSFGRTSTILIFGLTFLGLLFLFVLPFLAHEPDLLFKGYQYHTKAALAEWKGQSWQTPGTLPYQLSQGYGFAIFFYNKHNIQNSLQLLQHIHLAVSFLVPFFFTAWYFMKGKYWLPSNVFLILLLNLYLVFFFAFIQIPYAYLFFTPLVLSPVAVALICFFRVK